MARTPRGSRLVRSLTLLPAFAVFAQSAGAQEIVPTAEDEAKLAVLQEFLEGIEDFLPTVNLYDTAALPVTFPFRDERAHIVIDVDFGDGTTLPFMLDTGAPSIVRDEIGAAHGGDVVAEMVNIAAGNQIAWHPLLLVDEIGIEGALTIGNATVETGWDASGTLYCVTPNGLIGAQAMRNAIWQIDYGAQEITVAEGLDGLDHVEGAIELPFTIKPDTLSPTPEVELQVGDGTLRFLIDTGGGNPLVVSEVALASVGIEVPADAPRSANFIGGAGADYEAMIRSLVLPVGVAGTEFETTVFVADGLAPGADGNMGHVFLSNFVVTFDWSTQTVYLDPIAEDGSVELFADAGSAAVGFQDGQVKVTSLAVGGPSDEDGLSLGTVVTGIDGTDVSGLTLDEFCALEIPEEFTIATEDGATYEIEQLEGFFTGSN